MQLPSAFDARNVQPSQPMEPVPEGWYPVLVKNTEPQAVNGKPNAWYVKFTFEVIDGPYKGRNLFQNLNMGSDNPKAVEIAYRDLSAICHVTGKYVINTTDELHNSMLQVRAIINGGYNEIKGYKDTQGNDPGKTASAPAGVPTAMPPAAAPAGMPPQGQWQPPAGGAPAGYGAPAPAAAPGGWAPPPAATPAGYAAAPAPAAPAWQQGAPAPAAAQPPAAAPAAWQQQPAAGGGGAAPWTVPR